MLLSAKCRARPLKTLSPTYLKYLNLNSGRRAPAPAYLCTRGTVILGQRLRATLLIPCVRTPLRDVQNAKTPKITL